jgi:hypothetical protein
VAADANPAAGEWANSTKKNQARHRNARRGLTASAARRCHGSASTSRARSTDRGAATLADLVQDRVQLLAYDPTASRVPILLGDRRRRQRLRR